MGFGLDWGWQRDSLANVERMLMYSMVSPYFQKGTAHIRFKRSELVDKLNDIIARHYPGALATK